MIVKNEEQNLARVLSSVKTLADEIIIVDTGSQDRTVEVARNYGARVFHFAWCDDFSAARNESIRHARKDYILWLDADDEVESEEVPIIKKHLRKQNGTAVFLRIRNVRPGEIHEFIQLRCFPNGKGVRFKGRIHEQVFSALHSKGVPFSHCDGIICHHGYGDETGVRVKLERNRLILERELSDDPADFQTLFFLSRTLFSLGDKTKAVEYLDRALEIGRDSVKAQQLGIFKVAFLDKAGLLVGEGRTGEAISLLEENLLRGEGSDFFKYTLGELYFNTGSYEKAYRMMLPLQKAGFSRDILPVNVTAVRTNIEKYLGISSLVVGDLERAEVCLECLLSSNPHDPSHFHYLSLAREKRGDLDGAMRAVVKGLERGEQNDLLRKRLFLLLVEREDFEGALKEYDRLNGTGTETDVLAALFFMSCRLMNGEAIGMYYDLLQDRLNVPREAFPENLQTVRYYVESLNDPKTSHFFNSAITFLLEQTA
jgi:glycosyltransferase involved in cell wall biosynthesis